MSGPSPGVARASPRAPARRSAALRLAMSFAATGALVAVLLHDFGGPGLASAWRHANAVWVVFAFALSCVCVLLGALRWKLVLAAMRRPIGFGRALAVVLATWPPAVVTPSRANELLRAVAVRDAVPIASGASSVLVEKAVDLAILLAPASAGAAVCALWGFSAAAAVLLVAEGLVVAALVRRPRWLLRLGRARRPEMAGALLEGFEALRREPGKLASICAVSVGIRVLTAGVMQALLVSMGTRVRLLDTLALWPAATLVGVAPLTLGGMGTRDAAFIYLLRRGGAFSGAPPALFAATMGYSAVAVWSFALIGLPFMFREAACVGTGRKDGPGERPGVDAGAP
ncbi:MAG: flippase-like domain-containing protein [Myxococcales bacterium]|nr:flippase-like domain-containing protein [Myxococcales bacterium]